MTGQCLGKMFMVHRVRSMSWRRAIAITGKKERAAEVKQSLSSRAASPSTPAGEHYC